MDAAPIKSALADVAAKPSPNASDAGQYPALSTLVFARGFFGLAINGW